MYTDDPVKDYERRDREHQEWLDSLPRCEHCGEPIQEKYYFDIEGYCIHADCLTEFCEAQYLKRNNSLDD